MIKEYNIDINESIEIKYGSLNHKLPLVIYVACKAWVCPQDIGEYNVITNQSFSKFKSQLKSVIRNSPYFENKFVCDFDLNTETMQVNKKNYLSFEFYIKQKGNMLSLKQIKPMIEKSFKPLIDGLVEDFTENTFVLTKSKY